MGRPIRRTTQIRSCKKNYPKVIGGQTKPSNQTQASSIQIWPKGGPIWPIIAEFDGTQPDLVGPWPSAKKKHHRWPDLIADPAPHDWGGKGGGGRVFLFFKMKVNLNHPYNRTSYNQLGSYKLKYFLYIYIYIDTFNVKIW